jgi:hypothetical protein
MSKDDIISKVYFDPAGYGSINETLKDAKKYDSTITYDDVKKWKARNTERKTNLRGLIPLLLINLMKNLRWIWHSFLI